MSDAFKGGILQKGQDPQDEDESAAEEGDPGQDPEGVPGAPKFDPAIMNISAGFYDYINEDLIILKNNVIIKFQNIELYADRVEFYRDSNQLIAEGNVIFIQESDYIKGSKMDINLSNNTGIIYDADGYISEAFYIKGNRIIKYTDRDYQFRSSELTSCEESRRLWFFTSTSGFITREEYARLRNVILWFGRLPVFYLPYLVYPVKSERATGFLVPTAGHSTRRGWYIKNAFFLVISDYVDSTVKYDYYTDFGYTTSLEFRYVMGEGQAGTFTGMYSKEYENFWGEIVDEPTNKYSLNYLHRHYINRDINALLRLEYINVDNYYNMHGWDVNYATKNELHSYLSLSYNTGIPKGNLLFLLDVRRDLREEKGSELSKLPEVKYSILRSKILSDMYFGFNFSFTNFYYRDRIYNLRQQPYNFEYRDERAMRGKSNASLYYTIKVSSFLSITPSFNIFGAYYNRTYDIYDENQNYYNTDLISDPKMIYGYESSVSSEGPKFYRVFTFKNNSKMMHMIYPILEYNFRPYIDNREIPNLDGTDRFGPKDYYKYGITQKFFYKPSDSDKDQKSQSREIASISFYQFYDNLKKELLGYTSFEPPRRTEMPKSDYNLDINLYPSTYFRFKFMTRWDPYYKEFRSYNLDLSYHSFWIRSTINYWHYNRIMGDYSGFQADQTPGSFDNRSNRYISSNISVKILNTIGLGFALSYDIDREELRNGMVRAAYLHQCFSFQIAAIKLINNRYYQEGVDEWRYEFSFFFLNVGSVGTTDIPNDFVEDWGRRNYN